eukprot:TRINITY_DN1203_c0_g1_i2.p1 TRINITY_DN1203_c0_g1~~TRINITY_DN1203_c0_g1_i2.p1  ORF type:complete len:140 (+),score=19.56 TRINITY_DN1203_c0_g1_i2:233-652(+)
MAHGVRKEAVILEPRATNTGENIRYSRELLEERLGDADSKSYIVVQKPFMLRRSWATFRKQWPGPEFCCTGPLIGRLSEYVCEQMPLDSVLCAMVGDTQRLLYYAQVKEFQVSVHVPDQVWTALGKLVGLGYTQHLLSR